MADYIGVAIPRGGEGLIRRVAAEAKMPVIKHLGIEIRGDEQTCRLVADSKPATEEDYFAE